MNDTRRKQIKAVVIKLEAEVQELETIKEAEEEALDNMLEGLKEGENGSNSQDAITELEGAIDYLNDAIAALKTATGEE